MEKSFQIKKLVDKKVSFGLFLSDVISISLGFVLALNVAQSLQILVAGIAPQLHNGPYDQTYNYLSLIIFPLMLTLFYIKGHYTQRTPWWGQVRYIFGMCLITLVSDIFIRLILDLAWPEFFVSISSIFAFFLILIGRQLICFLANKLGFWNVKTVAIGTVDTVTDILYAFSTDYYVGYDIKTVLIRDRKDKEFDISAIPPKYKDIQIIRENLDYVEFVKNNLDHFYILSLETFRGEERDKFINELSKMNAIYSAIPPISSMNVFEMKPQNFFGCDIMLLHAKTSHVSFIKRFVKRFIDMFISGIALLFIAPIVLVVSLGLKIEGQGGSIFYGGYRLGRRGDKFKCWKFRSMEPDSDYLLEELFANNPAIKADWDKYRKLKVDDPRITTKTAKIIRKISVDELPQLWNVFTGDMSLVGPRPILMNEKELLGESYDNYIKVRPGITGLWQVSGRNDTTFQRRIHMDNWYVRNWSIWGDIVILIKTVLVVLKGSGSY